MNHIVRMKTWEQEMEKAGSSLAVKTKEKDGRSDQTLPDFWEIVFDIHTVRLRNKSRDFQIKSHNAGYSQEAFADIYLTFGM